MTLQEIKAIKDSYLGIVPAIIPLFGTFRVPLSQKYGPLRYTCGLGCAFELYESTDCQGDYEGDI